MVKRKRDGDNIDGRSMSELRSDETRLQKKKKELKAAKAKYQKVAKEFIDLWVKIKRAKRGTKDRLTR